MSVGPVGAMKASELAAAEAMRPRGLRHLTLRAAARLAGNSEWEEMPFGQSACGLALGRGRDVGQHYNVAALELPVSQPRPDCPECLDVMFALEVVQRQRWEDERAQP